MIRVRLMRQCTHASVPEYKRNKTSGTCVAEPMEKINACLNCTSEKCKGSLKCKRLEGVKK